MDTDLILTQSRELAPEVTKYRRHIHSHPELSFREEETAAYISEVLTSLGISHRRIAGTGILAKIEGSGDLKRAVVLRADMDALPIREKNESNFRSANEGVMHACGHDMHTAALLGALTLINRNRDSFEGTLFGLFQPGEELCPGGASMVLAEKPFEGYDVRAFIGEHVDPELPTGTFGFRPGKYMASSDEVRITIRGEGGHGAMPQKLKDPVVAAAAVITALQQIVSRNDNPGTPTVLSIGKVIADGATNVIPDDVYMEGTFRTFDEYWRTDAKNRIREIAQATASAYGVEADVDIRDGYPCVVNSESLTAIAIDITKKMFGDDAVTGLDIRSTAEDFGYYTQVYNSVSYRIGVGGKGCSCGKDGGRRQNIYAGKLHTSTFNPDEAALEYAVANLANLAFNISE